MIHEIFGIKNNIVDLTSFDVPKELEKIVLSTHADEFFRQNMYKDFGEIGEVIRRLIADFQSRMKSHQNIENITDIKDFISSYPEFKKMSGTVSKHVNLVSEISKIVTSKDLMKVSECEQNVSSGGVRPSELDTLKDLLTAKTVSDFDKKKLLCLFFLSNGQNQSQLAPFVHLATRGNSITARICSYL